MVRVRLSDLTNIKTQRNLAIDKMVEKLDSRVTYGVLVCPHHHYDKPVFSIYTDTNGLTDEITEGELFNLHVQPGIEETIVEDIQDYITTQMFDTEIVLGDE